MKKLICFFTLLSVGILVAQDKSKSNQNRFLPEYKSFSLFNLGMGMNLDLPTTITEGGIGGSLEIGFNLAKPFSENILISPYIGLGVSSAGSYKEAFRTHLVDDFEGFPTAYTNLQSQDPSFLSNEELGLLASYEQAADELNHITNNNIKSKLTFSYGVMVKLPSKYVPLIKLYKSKHYISGTEESRPSGFIIYDPSSTDPFSDLAGSIDIEGFGLEIDLFTGWFTSTLQHDGNVRLGQISLYSEWYDLKSLEIGNKEDFTNFSVEKKPITSFFDSSETFTEVYKKEVRVGIKIGISIL